MGVKTYGFQTQLAKGIVGEQVLSDYFSEHGYDIISYSDDRETQRKGIDALFTFRNSGNSFTVEYKTDLWTRKTGNAFIETVSVIPDNNNKEKKLGWAYTSQADTLIYAAVDVSIVIVKMEKIKLYLDDWSILYKKAYARNNSYLTEGLKVPFDKVREISIKEIDWEDFA